MPTPTPGAVDRFLAAERAADADALAACFLPEGVVLDEGRTHVGRADIAAWRRAAAKTYTYTAEVTARERLGPDAYKVIQHLEGDFPGGVADLEYRFALAGEHIAALMVFLVGH